jgi:hypothetical protein
MMDFAIFSNFEVWGQLVDKLRANRFYLNLVSSALPKALGLQTNLRQNLKIPWHETAL